MTMNVYGRTRQEDLSEVVSEMAESDLGTKTWALYVPRLAVSAERENATPFELKELRSLQSGSGGRARTPITAFGQF